MQSTHNPAIDEIREEMAQMRTELGLVRKYITGGAEKINAVTTCLNHHLLMMNAIMQRTPMQYMSRHVVFDRAPAQGSNQDNLRQGQGNQGRIYGNYNREAHDVRDGNYNRDNNFNRGNYGNKNDMSFLKIVKLLLGMMDIVWCELRIC